MADRHGEGPGHYEGLGPKVGHVVSALDLNQRLAGIAAFVLLLSPALPWFSQTGIERIQPLIYPPPAPTTHSVSVTLTGFQSFKWIEAALVLVAIAVLAMVVARGQRRAFHLPGGDGVTIAAAGGWCLLLMFWRSVVARPSHPGLETGVEWGLLVPFAASLAILVAGLRMRSEGTDEPPLPAAAPGNSGATDLYDDIDPTVEQLAIPLGDQPRRTKRRTRRKG